MHYRQRIVTLTSVSPLVCAVLLAGCGKYGSDADETSYDVNANTTDQISDGNGAGDTTTSGANGNEGASGDTTAGEPDTTGSGETTTEGAPDVDRAPTTDGEGEPDGEATPEGEPDTTPEGEPDTTPEGEPEVIPEEPVVVIGERPCDIYAAGGTPCVGAYSMVRLLAADYTGPLYQVRRSAPNPFRNSGVGGQTADIGFTPDGYADAAAQNAFCGNQSCTVSILYDQSPQGNDLTVANGGCYAGGDGAALEDDFESDAKRQQLMVGGRNLYGLYINPHEGYRNNQAVGTAEGQQAQSMYMVADGQHAGPACCWDFGTAARDTCFGPTGIMSSLMLGWGYWGTGAGGGPWMMGDFELGVWSGGSFATFGLDPAVGPAPPASLSNNPANPSLAIPFAVGMLSTRVGSYALRMGDARTGNLTTAYDGPTGITWNLGGGIILGIGGDNSNWSYGTFYEGAITRGAASPGVDQQVYRNVQTVGYGR